MATFKIEIPDKDIKKLFGLVEELGGKVISANSRKKLNKSDKEHHYNPEFVAKIEKSLQQANEGKVVKIPLDDIWK
jgi:hypothetical protein